MVVSNFVLHHIRPYLDAGSRWRLRRLCRLTRNWVMSPELEKMSMLNCLRECYGNWNVDGQMARAGKTFWNDSHSEFKSWLELELELEYERQHDMTKKPEKIVLGPFVYERQRSYKLDGLLQKLRWLSPSWIRGERDTHCGSYYYDLGIYALIEGGPIKGSLSKLTDKDLFTAAETLGQQRNNESIGLSWHEDWDYTVEKIPKGALRVISSKTPSDVLSRMLGVSEEKSIVRSWIVPGCDVGEAPCDACQFRPQEFLVLMLSRLALEDASLVHRLVDINDPLTPSVFLKALASFEGEWQDDDLSDYDAMSDGGETSQTSDDVSDNDDDSKVSGIDCDSLTTFLWRRLNKLFVKHSGILELNPAIFWDTNHTISRRRQGRRWVEASFLHIEDDWEFWEVLGDAIHRHEIFYRQEIVKVLELDPNMRPLRVSCLAKFDPNICPHGEELHCAVHLNLTPEGGEGYYGRMPLSLLHLTSSGAFLRRVFGATDIKEN